MSSLGKDWSDSWMAPKPNEAFGPRLGDREADSKWSGNSTLMPPFSRLRLESSRSVLKLCRRETAGAKICGDLL